MLNNFDLIQDVELELSTYCNAKCPLCYRNYTAFKEHYPSNNFRPLEDIIKQLDEYKNLKYIRLVGSISEPTLYPKFLELVQYIKSRNIIIELCTNGDTNTPEWWKELGTLLSSEDSVYFTICGSTQEIHEIYRKGTNLKNILINAESFRTINKNDYAQCIRFNYNDDDFSSDNFKNVIKDFSNVYWTETFLLKNSDNYVIKDNLDLLTPNKSKINNYINIEKLANIKWEKKLSKSRNCKAFNEKRNQIDVYGNVYPCYLFLEASKGSLWDGDWSKILNSEYEVCKFCDKDIVQLCNDKNLDYII